MKTHKGRFLVKIVILTLIWCFVSFLFYRIGISKHNLLRSIGGIMFLGLIFFLMVYDTGHYITIYKNKIVIKNQFNFFDKVGKTFYIKDIEMIHIFESGRNDSITIYFQGGKKKIYSIAIPKLDDLQRDLEEQGVKVKRGW